MTKYTIQSKSVLALLAALKLNADNITDAVNAVKKQGKLNEASWEHRKFAGLSKETGDWLSTDKGKRSATGTTTDVAPIDFAMWEESMFKMEKRFGVIAISELPSGQTGNLKSWAYKFPA